MASCFAPARSDSDEWGEIVMQSSSTWSVKHIASSHSSFVSRIDELVGTLESLTYKRCCVMTLEELMRFFVVRTTSDND